MISVLFLGNPQVGKSSLVSRFCNIAPSTFYTPTEGIDHNYKTVNLRGQRTVIQFWDVSGNQQMNPVVRFYYQKANAFVVMFSLADYQSFKSVKEWMARIRKNGDPNAKIFLVGGKADLVGREVTEESIEKLRKKYGVSYYEFNFRDNNCSQKILKDIMENTPVNVNRDFSLGAVKDSDDSQSERNQYLEETMAFSQTKQGKPHNLIDAINTKVKSLVKSSKSDDNEEVNEQWRNELRRIEAHFEAELRHIRRDLVKAQDRDLDSPKQIELEIANKIRLLSIEQGKEQDKKIDQLYQIVESFKGSIMEEMMQSIMKTKLALDGNTEEIDALKNRVRALEKNAAVPALNGSSGRPSRDIPEKSSSDTNEEATRSAIDRLENVSKLLYEEVSTVKKKTEHNEDRINGLFLFVERELKQTESHLINELNQKLKDITEVGSSRVDQQSDYNPEFDNMIKDLNESIRRCILDTDNFYNNLRQQAITADQLAQNADQTFAPIQEELHTQSALLENVRGSLGDVRLKNKFVSMSIAVPLSDDGSAVPEQDKENTPVNIQPQKKMMLSSYEGKPESEGAIKKPKLNRLEKASKSYQEIHNTLSNFAVLQNNLRSYKEIPLNLSSPAKQRGSQSTVQDEMARMWDTINRFMQSTQEEIGKMKSDIGASRKFNILRERDVDAQLNMEDIKDVLKNIQGELREEVVVLQRECEAMFKGLKDMIVNYYDDSLERIELNKQQLENLVQSKLKTRNDVPSKFFGGLKAHIIEHIPSDIVPQGTMSPPDDVSFDLKLLDKKISNRPEKEEKPKDSYKGMEKRQMEGDVPAIEEKLNSFWATTSVMAERIAKLEEKVRTSEKVSPKSKETRKSSTLFWI